ncbi:MAG: RIO1 family regulatory kinase/ATPase domain-containing protein, partial [Promethearchaeota archaeon]
AKMIHGDLGEFNIVVDHKDNILIIDWLQWVPSDHPNANTLLERDIGNVCNFFKKKYHIESNPLDIIQSFKKKK